MAEGQLDIFIKKNTDKYFSNTRNIVEENGDKKVVYAVFVRKPAIYACARAISFIKHAMKERGSTVNIYENFKEQDQVPAGEPLFFIEGSFKYLVELETLILQQVGISCICAWHGYMMSKALPKVSFLSMIARHCANADMVEAAEYGVSVGSKLATTKGAIGFIGCSTENNVKYFSEKQAIGTMPHCLIGYAGSTLLAAKMYYEAISQTKMTVLVDYFGKEITDSLEVCNYFKDLAEKGNLSIRLDTHGGRFLQGLDHDKSYQILEKHVPDVFNNYKDHEEITFLAGMGVSAAAIFYVREKLDEAGFQNVKIVVSSGFNIKKCVLMAKVSAPIDFIGTGSFMPDNWTDTYATADVVSYDGVNSVKKGREFLLNKWVKRKHEQN